MYYWIRKLFFWLIVIRPLTLLPFLYSLISCWIVMLCFNIVFMLFFPRLLIVGIISFLASISQSGVIFLFFLDDWVTKTLLGLTAHLLDDKSLSKQYAITAYSFVFLVGFLCHSTQLNSQGKETVIAANQRHLKSDKWIDHVATKDMQTWKQ